MSRSRGKRYNTEAKLNKKKVAAVIIAILVIIMFVMGIREILKDKPEKTEKSFVLAYYTIYENGKWGVIDQNGNIIKEPTYELSDYNPKFIGEYYEVSSIYQISYYSNEL